MATIAGTFKLSDENYYVGRLTFTPLSTPQVDGTDVITSNVVSTVTDPYGDISQVLVMGSYLVDLVDANTRVNIDVPDTNDTLNFEDLITDDLETYTTDWPLYRAQKYATTDVNYYVATTGSDSANTGRTVGSPFLTIQHAVDVAAKYWIAGEADVIINVADGTYNIGATSIDMSACDSRGDNRFILLGNTTTPANVAIQSSAIDVIKCRTSKALVRGVSLTSSSGSFGGCLRAADHGIIEFGNVKFLAHANGSHIYATDGAVIRNNNPTLGTFVYEIAGDALYHAYTSRNAIIGLLTATGVTITGSRAFNQFVYAVSTSYIYSTSGPFSGTVTGQRYYSINNSHIDTGGGGASHFPGSVAGGTATGGIYT